jgi:hypothetical protein
MNGVRLGTVTARPDPLRQRLGVRGAALFRGDNRLSFEVEGESGSGVSLWLLNLREADSAR